MTWEPTEEQIEAYYQAWEYTTTPMPPESRQLIIASLSALHAAGFDLTLTHGRSSLSA